MSQCERLGCQGAPATEEICTHLSHILIQVLSKFMDNMLKAGTRELKEVSQEVRGISPKCKAASCLEKLRAEQGADRMPSKAVREGAGTPGNPPPLKKNQRNGYWGT